MSETYADGVGVERCTTCGRGLRDKAGEQLVYVKRTDVEALIDLIAHRIGWPGLWADTAERLQQAVGLSDEAVKEPKAS